MRLLKMSGFSLLTLASFLIVLYIYTWFLAATMASGMESAQVLAAVKVLGSKAFQLAMGFLLIGGALTYLAARREKIAKKTE